VAEDGLPNGLKKLGLEINKCPKTDNLANNEWIGLAPGLELGRRPEAIGGQVGLGLYHAVLAKLQRGGSGPGLDIAQ
jgi:hypothetical protein